MLRSVATEQGLASKRVSKRQDATYHSRAKCLKYTAQGCGKVKCKRVDRYLTKNAHAMYNLYSPFLEPEGVKRCDKQSDVLRLLHMSSLNV